jgi:hypothetical protein
MNLFNLDLHISVIEDVKTILTDLGHTVDSKSLSGHTWVFGREPDQMDVVSQENWKTLNQEMCDAFYKRYKDELSTYDGFLVTYPPAFSLLFEKFDKPIFVVAATRYEAPFSNNMLEWEWFNSKIVDMIDRGQLIPLTNNLYDKFYCEHFTKKEWKHIPSICEYTKAKYTGTEEESILSAKSRLLPPHCKHIKSLGRHTWEDLYRYKSIVHIPYNVSIMSIFEQYTANVPLLFPSPECGMKIPGFLSETFFHPNIINDAKLQEIINVDTLKLADYYDKEWMPHVLHYTDGEHLNELLETTDFEEVSNSMKIFNEERKKKVYSLWEEVMNGRAN